MSKTGKGWLTAAIIMIAVGAAMFLISLGALGFDAVELGTVKSVTNEYKFTERADKIEINTSTANIRFLNSEDGIIKIVCTEVQNDDHDVSLIDGILRIEQHDDRKWYEKIGISFEGETSVTLYLPDTDYEYLTLLVSTGDIEVPGDFSFGTANITSTTGDTSWAAETDDILRIYSSTGRINISSSSAGTADIQTSTGRVTISGFRTDGDITIGTSTGSVTLSDLICGGKLTAETSTGNVNFKLCDAEELSIKTSTGDVRGSFLSPKIFRTSTSTGSIQVPDSGEGGLCEITTNTGDIKIELP